MNRQLDILLVNPNSSKIAYQELADTYSAIEPPTWALLLGESCRSKGFGVAILDCDAERLTPEQSVKRVEEYNPRLVCIVAYGQNPNSGTTNMVGATLFAKTLRKIYPEYKTCFVGSHTSALPREVLALSFVDFVLLNEGVYALRSLLTSDMKTDLHKIDGIGYKDQGELVLNRPEKIVPQNMMDHDLPGYAWDLLPFEKKPLDLYRSHFWHAGFDHERRQPFAAIYSSLGCRYGCNFCMINILNREDNGDLIDASHSRVMRYWSSEFILKEFEKLARMGVSTVRLSDEMFFLDKRHFEPLIDGLIQRDYGFHFWAYSRVDTVREQFLDQFRKAGIDWLALGIEASNQNVRQLASKGSYKEVNIREVCDRIQSHDINIISNYIFGFPEDTFETMQETLDLALELNTETANMYPCQALPGSPLYREAISLGWKLPDTYEGYGFLSYESQPLPTKYVSAKEVLRFRDDAWQKYFTNPAYLNLVESKFGTQQRGNVQNMAAIKLKRKILGD